MYNNLTPAASVERLNGSVIHAPIFESSSGLLS
jgi:hypothetical protein